MWEEGLGPAVASKGEGRPVVEVVGGGDVAGVGWFRLEEMWREAKGKGYVVVGHGGSLDRPH